MNSYENWIEQLNMEKHPEGGHYALTYQSPYEIESKDINASYDGKRSLATSIYFLINDQEVSNFHRLDADEIWYFHEGSPLTVAVIYPDGTLKLHKLGLNINAGENPQLLVPAGTIFGSYTEQGHALVGCMVSYGFHFDDFELFERNTLLTMYPQHENIIKKLTRV